MVNPLSEPRKEANGKPYPFSWEGRACLIFLHKAKSAQYERGTAERCLLFGAYRSPSEYARASFLALCKNLLRNHILPN